MSGSNASGPSRGGLGSSSQLPHRSGPPPKKSAKIFQYGPVNAPDPAVTRIEDLRVSNPRTKTNIYPPRPGYGNVGKEVILWANYLKITPDPKKEIGFYKYTVSCPASPPSKTMMRLIIMQILEDPKFSNMLAASDYSTIVVTTAKLDLGSSNTWEGVKEISDLDEPSDAQISQATRRRRTKRFTVKPAGGPFHPNQFLQYVSQTAGEPHYADKDDIIQMMNIIMGSFPQKKPDVYRIGKTNKFYSDAFASSPNNPENTDLGFGLRALRGYYSSVRPATGRILLNLNVTSGAFYKPVPLPALVMEYMGNRAPSSKEDFEKLEAFVNMLKVETKYFKVKDKDGKDHVVRKNKTILGFAPFGGSATKVTFRYKDVDSGETITTTVADFFKNHHGVTLAFPQQPVVNVGSKGGDPVYLPLELCTVLPGQAIRKMLGGNQTSKMITFAARPPPANGLSITTDGLAMFGLGAAEQASALAPFGFSVNDRLVTVPGRILPPPVLQFGRAPVTPRDGSWNLANKKFSQPGFVRSWACWVINHAGSNSQALAPQGNGLLGRDALLAELHKVLSRNCGIKIQALKGTTDISIANPETIKDRAEASQRRKDINKILKAEFAKAKDTGVTLLFVVLKEFDRWVYSRIKYYGDVVYGIQTINSIGKKLQKVSGQQMYMGNLALKFNVKGGGVSHTIQESKMSPLDDTTMVVGADVSHPAPDSKEDTPSISAVVANCDKFLCQWPGSIRIQEGRKEMMSHLEDMVMERLDMWMTTHKQLPKRIVVYRDGVSEGQYQQVLGLELPSYHKAFQRKYGEAANWPKMAIIIVGKRHHTRFYPTSAENADPNNSNPLAGTVVDRGVTDSYLWDFFLQAHQGLQGTARPAHYVVIYDQIGFQANQLEQFTHNMCYLFNRATKAVSICPPAYYADLLCERGRMYLFSKMNDNIGSVASNTGHVDEDEDWNGTIHANIRDTTYYI